MKRILTATSAALAFPAFAFAQSIQGYLVAIIEFFNGILVPFILAIAFLCFIWGMFRYFILEGTSEAGQSKGKSLALWGIAAFVIIISLWGLVNMLVSSFNIRGTAAICPDYNPNCNSNFSNGPGFW